MWNRKIASFLTLILSAGAIQAAAPSVSFNTPKVFLAGGSPWSLVKADFNGDGILDLATANGQSGNISILLGNGDGTFQAPVDYGVCPPEWPPNWTGSLLPHTDQYDRFGQVIGCGGMRHSARHVV